MIIPVILCGGSGTRLWPLSRELYPKQLIALTGEHTLLQQTVMRLSGIKEVGSPIIICNEEHRFLVAEQLRQVNIQADTIILEPVGRNTAPATALAALRITHEQKDSTMLVLPADHLIEDTQSFHDAVEAAVKIAQTNNLVTFGVVPKGPETGYGYIKKGEPHGKNDQKGQQLSFKISQFVEKPDLKTAEGYLADGNFFWNSGMFVFKASVFLAELEKNDNKIFAQCQRAYAKSTVDLDFTRVDTTEFSACPSDSIDYAVMEKTAKGIIIPVDVGWNDIGSWSALWDVGPKDQNGNVVHGDVMMQATSNSFIHSSNRLIATIGLEDCIIVDTADAVMVAKKNSVQDVKKIVNSLRALSRQEASLHKCVYRPWGSYEGMISGERFQVKIITVKPGAILSLQMHHHRAEHWIVVKGTAIVTKGTTESTLHENESTYIPLGETHRLENPGVIPLELIEVQTGSYLGEDDIVRFEDNYGRLEN
ncbi:MAG: mannose-1-phosphate guanylyltransferase/mannose-6-phosphate isomerase [Desulforhopalus sp.]|jgi:mannose-1-phosphate guanylyltransferase/mannose-6-phosphate isomerase